MSNNKTTRRTFIKQSAAAVSIGYFVGAGAVSAADNKKDRFTVGQVGCGGMGSGDAGNHERSGGKVIATADVDIGRAKKLAGRFRGNKAVAEKDYRKLIDRKDIDVISIGTVDHWHVKIAIEALQAGKHVFSQKPLSLTVEENQLARAAAKKYDKQVFFIGTQQRSDRQKFLRAVNMVQKGLLGKIKKITVGIDGGRRGGPFNKTDPPAELDWNMWQGQTPAVDYIRERCHYTYRWWYEYSGCKFTDWGAHHVDIALWGIDLLGEGQGPIAFDGTDAKHPVPFKDGYPTVDNCYNTADNYSVLAELPGGAVMDITSRAQNGILFEGEKGRIFVNRGKITGKPIEENWDKDVFTDENIRGLYKGKQYEPHKRNFYRCIREGGLPVSDVYSHTQAMTACHLAAIAARLNCKFKWDPKTEKITDNQEAASFLARKPRKGFEIPRV